MDDLISRLAAIDALDGEIKLKDSDDVDSVALYIQQVARKINELPSAQQWIPCSERMPNEGVEVLVSAWTDSIMIAWLEDGEWTTDEFSFEENCDVIAWCPLPEPYKGEDNATVN